MCIDDVVYRAFIYIENVNVYLRVELNKDALASKGKPAEVSCFYVDPDGGNNGGQGGGIPCIFTLGFGC